MIDHDGFRPNVGIILSNRDRRLFWGRRVGQNAWQFPQGGINADETPEEAMYRELEEEVGLNALQVTILGSTRGWLRYHLPKRYIRRHCGPTCIGQKQVWFAFRFEGDEAEFDLGGHHEPEFEAWRWVDLTETPELIVPFKRATYEAVVSAFRPFASPGVATR